MRSATIILATVFFVITACKKAGPYPPIEKDIYTIDSFNVTDTIKITDSFSMIYSSKKLYFPFIQNTALLNRIYFQYKDSAYFSKQELEIYMERDLLKHYDHLKNLRKTKNLNGVWVYSSEMEVKFLLHQYLHIQYTDIHNEGYTMARCTYKDKMFDLKNNRELILEDITKISREQLLVLLKKNMYKIFFNAVGDPRIHEFDERMSKMNGLHEIPDTGNFYFDNNGLYFHYNPHEIISSSFLDFVIPISWDQLEGTLSDDFKERMNIDDDF
ncbi:hypothetical protein ACP3T3_00825 [Chryseobacterium sp. CBSDS_008]|uniref:hypothetical protein n=1 Tax=Chryseobacterium sp. CBSDS_008 TaxID=3415265 RepID=UPI003CF2827D